jgi:PcfJ-like protein
MLTEQSTSDGNYSLLPSQEWWRQVLIFPTIDIREDGVSLNKCVSNYMLWIELESRRVWGFTIWTFTPFISFRVLERIAQRLEYAQPNELKSILPHLAILAGWRKAEPSELVGINMIAEDQARAEIRSKRENALSVTVAEENIRLAAQPYKASFVRGMLRFNDTLDRDVMALIGNEPILSLDDAVAYNYLIHPVVKKECYRRQAIQTFPLLRAAFSRVTAEFSFQRLQQNVDSGNPLLPVLADYFRCPMPVVRFLVGKDYALIGEEWHSQLDQLVDLLSTLKPSFWPKTAEDWPYLSRWILPVLDALGNLRSRDNPEMLATCLNDLAKEGYARIPLRMERHGVTLEDLTTIPDFERALCEWSAQFGTNQSKARDALWQYSIMKIAILSHRWHDWLLRRMEDEEISVEENTTTFTGWKSLISSPWQNDQHKVVPLNNPWILQEEGRRMQHCVGTYVSQCRYFGSHIFSIRNLVTGQSLSTMELKINKGSSGIEDDIVVVQHRAFGNAPPSEACCLTRQEFLHYLRITVTRDTFIELSKQLYKRRMESEDYRKFVQNPAWPPRMVVEFGELLHGYPLLESIKSD